jgi:hypothetical protein
VPCLSTGLAITPSRAGSGPAISVLGSAARVRNTLSGSSVAKPRQKCRQRAAVVQHAEQLAQAGSRSAVRHNGGGLGRKAAACAEDMGAG